MKLKTLQQYETEKGSQTAAAKALGVGLTTYRQAKETKKPHYVLITKVKDSLIQDKTPGSELIKNIYRKL